MAMGFKMRALTAAVLCIGVSTGTAIAAELAPEDAALRAAIANPQRSERFIKRDAVRHPYEELRFFGITPLASVIEIWPGGGYWTEILAPYLRDHGTYYAAIESPTESATASTVFKAKLESNPAVYDRVQVTELGSSQTALAPEESADVILTFRNLHNWLKQGNAKEVLARFYKALKPGGILGIEDHRGQRDVAQDPKALDGYVRQDYAIALVESAGFRFVAASEINANPKDTANWPKGVWTLPPTFALGDNDRERYAAIGEADNFVLKFRKPVQGE